MLDALYAAFYLIKGMANTLIWKQSEALVSFNNFGNHFGGFILAASLALITPLLELVALSTRAVASCFENSDKDLDSALTGNAMC